MFKEFCYVVLVVGRFHRKMFENFSFSMIEILNKFDLA